MNGKAVPAPIWRNWAKMRRPSNPVRNESAVSGPAEPPATILVVDDDPTVREVVLRYLSRDGHRVVESSTGPHGLAAFRAQHPDLVVLDLMLPGMDGLTVCETIRAESGVPVIMLTARGEESDRVLGLEHGADDYLVKPFSPRELALRVAGVLRRTRAVQAATGDPVAAAEPVSGGVLTDGELRVDTRARLATRAGRALSLTVREFDLLAHLLSHPSRVFTRDELMEQVWGWTFGDTATVTVHVRRLREKVEDDPADPRRIATVWGVGYRYDPAVA